ncbi:hypothetical protein GKE82_10970 [Conexibacter sp. W3-3-2]|uniref:cytochrome b/b6 domain-containing protein n=1 Tax=Conexibacter sp. W3-3-2 TaxID=2675227 RepID=UPI0012B96E7F|nr:cytochrome b/b6 domain-containing protein [Conexibacter sp. W3-3-2]MTD44797.1 hypothetical protein [Conexibacter sp. W3-3-2]
MSHAAVPLVRRFSGTERLLHWTHTAGFLAMLGTGLLLYVPAFSDVLGGRPTAKAAHLGASIAWLVAMALVVLLGDRRGLHVTLQEIDRFDQDDRDWLRRRGTPPARFNAGQKLHTVVQAGFAALFVASGTLLWLSERVNGLRLQGTIVVHDAAMFGAVALLLGHLWLALVWPPTRHAMRGIVRGTVRASWAARHHPRWRAASAESPRTRWTVPRSAWLASVLILVVGGTATAYVVDDSLGDRAGEEVSIAPPAAPQPASAAAAAAPPVEAEQVVPPPDPGADPLQLAAEAQQLQQDGRLNAAIERYRIALRGLPGRPDVRAAYGIALVDAGNEDEGFAQLRRATRHTPRYEGARLALGLELLDAGRAAEGRAQLRRYLRSAAPGPGADVARAALERDAR